MRRTRRARTGAAGLVAVEQGVSTWRQVLAENWEEMRALTDWMGIPAMHGHVAELHAGHPRSVGGDWVDHSPHRHLRPLAERLAARDDVPGRLLFSSFPVQEVSPLGGTLLRPLLARWARNFRSAGDHCILKLLMMLERELIRSGRLSSGNLDFVLGRSGRLNE